MQGIQLSQAILEIIARQNFPELCDFFCGFLEEKGLLVRRVREWKPSEQLFVPRHPASQDQQDPSLPSEWMGRLLPESVLIEPNSPCFHQDRPDWMIFDSVFLLPLFHESELIGVVDGFLSDQELAAAAAADRLRETSRLFAQAWHLLRVLERKDQLGLIDSLTGLSNYQSLMQFLTAELQKPQQHDRGLAVIFLDIDSFKQVNDLHGHLVGTRVLGEVASVLRINVRNTDLVARYGGDEYVVVLRESGIRGVARIAERLRRAVGNHSFDRAEGNNIRITVSAGVAIYPTNGTSATELIGRADQAMYLAKKNRKNCIRFAIA